MPYLGSTPKRVFEPNLMLKTKNQTKKHPPVATPI